MSITVFIRYQLDPFKRPGFEEYARRWLAIIPKCGGELVGYWVPHEGTNNIAFALISFDSLASYESYRARLRAGIVCELTTSTLPRVGLMLRSKADQEGERSCRSRCTTSA